MRNDAVLVKLIHVQHSCDLFDLNEIHLSAQKLRGSCREEERRGERGKGEVWDHVVEEALAVTLDVINPGLVSVEKFL